MINIFWSYFIELVVLEFASPHMQQCAWSDERFGLRFKSARCLLIASQHLYALGYLNLNVLVVENTSVKSDWSQFICLLISRYVANRIISDEIGFYLMSKVCFRGTWCSHDVLFFMSLFNKSLLDTELMTVFFTICLQPGWRVLWINFPICLHFESSIGLYWMKKCPNQQW